MQHNTVKQALTNKNNRGGISFMSLAAGTKLDTVDTSTDIFDEKNESNLSNDIACDLGGLIHLAGEDNLRYSKFLIEPQIGVKIKDRYRVALGYAAYNAQGNEESNYISSESVSSLNLKLGLDF